jgi:inhibitor of cysteine peptidase
MVLGPESNGRTIAVRHVENILIRLPGNPTTGYSWVVASVKGEAVKLSGEVQYTPEPTPTPRVGSGGTFKIPLRVAAQGESVVTLEYRRPWEKDATPAQSFSVILRVENVAYRR